MVRLIKEVFQKSEKDLSDVEAQTHGVSPPRNVPDMRKTVGITRQSPELSHNPSCTTTISHCPDEEADISTAHRHSGELHISDSLQTLSECGDTETSGSTASGDTLIESETSSTMSAFQWLVPSAVTLSRF